MKKVRCLIVCAIIISLVALSAASASAFDFTGWVKKVLGIQEKEEPTEVFVPTEEIKIEEEVSTESPVEEKQSEESSAKDAETEEVTEEKEETGVEEKEVTIVEEKTEETTQEQASSEQTSGEEKVIIAQETDKISLQTEAEDPDEDTLTFKYTSPLDDKGEWQTTYGDEGEYTVTITVSDGTLSDSKDVLIIVNKREEAPTIDTYKPDALALDASEDSELEFAATASDLNKDELEYQWLLDDKEVSTTESFLFKMDYSSAGEHVVKLIVTDGVKETTKVWSVDIKNINRKPELEPIDDITVKETETVTIVPKAVDPDGSEITYTISAPVGDSGVWKTTYDDAGEYDVVVTASDGEDEVSQTVKVTVENVNRAPLIKDIVRK